MKRILVTGATGQIGSALVPALRLLYGSNNVLALGHKKNPPGDIAEDGPYGTLDIQDQPQLEKYLAQYNIDTIYHLAAMLSATAERNPQRAWDVNINGLMRVLEVARKFKCSVFHPSSIGAFGPTTPADQTPQVTIQRPVSMYGVSKVTGELLCDYYHSKFNLDTRGVRFPGLISYEMPPGGGTTDYAVDIFYAAVQNKTFHCFLKPDTHLDMMYMPDAVQAAIQIMEADAAKLKYRNAYNITAMSFTPDMLYQEIKKHLPEFTMAYTVGDIRQSIADSWPNSLDDSSARTDWDWQPKFDIESMTTDMLEKLACKLQEK